jgi:YcxB-like protein
MGDEPKTEPTIGALELDEHDLRAAIIDLSFILRARVGIGVVLAFIFGVLALGRADVAQVARQLIPGALFVAYLFVSPVLRGRQLLRAIVAGGDKHASYRFDDDGVTFRSAGSTMTAAYRSLVEFREGKTAFFVYTAPGVANIVPKRAFPAEELSRVRARLAANVKPRALTHASRRVVLIFAALLAFFVVWQFLSSTGATPDAR